MGLYYGKTKRLGPFVNIGATNQDMKTISFSTFYIMWRTILSRCMFHIYHATSRHRQIVVRGLSRVLPKAACFFYFAVSFPLNLVHYSRLSAWCSFAQELYILSSASFFYNTFGMFIQLIDTSILLCGLHVFIIRFSFALWSPFYHMNLVSPQNSRA